MAEMRWDDIDGTEIQYADHTWKLTGDVELLDSGDVLAVEGMQTDDVQGESAMLFFDVADPPGSLNPGNPDDLFHDLVWEDGGQRLVVETEGPTYRYELRRLEYE